MSVVEGKLDGEEGRALQRDAPAPRLAQFGEDRPGDGGLRRHRIDMRAQRHRAMRIGAFEPELHAGAQVARAPILAIELAGQERRGEVPVRVSSTRPDMSLVEMGVHIRESGQDDPAVEVEKRGRILDRGRSRRERGDPPVLDEERSGSQAVLIGQEPSSLAHRDREPRVHDAVAREEGRDAQGFAHIHLDAFSKLSRVPRSRP